MPSSKKESINPKWWTPLVGECTYAGTKERRPRRTASWFFFAEFLATTGVFERWVSSCPLEYRSGNAPTKRDVLGTLMLSLLAGHRRYAHITALRGDAVAAQALGMNKVVSEDALRRALERIDEASSTMWMRPALMHSVRQALDKPWVLDIDATIKPLYGRQEGAQLVYNWWSWYCRTANPSARMAAVTSRPLLLAAVGTVANHAGQTTLYLTPLHGKVNTLKPLIANIRAALQHVKDTAEQFNVIDRWAVLLRYVSDKIAPALGPFRPPDVLAATG